MKMNYKLYQRRFNEDLIDDLSTGNSDIYSDPIIDIKSYKIVDVGNGYKDFLFKDNFDIDKVTGIEIDPSFKELIDTEQDTISSSNYFYTIYFDTIEDSLYYKYGAISISETELYKLARDYKIEEAIMGKYILRQGSKTFYTYR